MIVSHQYKFIFVKTLKTASTSIEVFLSNHCAPGDIVTPIYPTVPSHCPRNYHGLFNPLPELSLGGCYDALKALYDITQQRKFYNHIPASRLSHRLPKSVWDSYFKFCVERNPWDKVVSHYHMHRSLRDQNYTFTEHLSAKMFPLNHPLYLSPKTQLPMVDRVIHYETLEKDLGEVLALLKIPYNGSLEVHAKSNYRLERIPYQDYYTEAQRKFIEQAFAVEIALHHYRF
jgi:hypothetical protein